MPESAATARALLRHTLATLAYRSAKALRDTPPGFSDVRAGAHIFDVADFPSFPATGSIGNEDLPHVTAVGTPFDPTAVALDAFFPRISDQPNTID